MIDNDDDGVIRTDTVPCLAEGPECGHCETPMLCIRSSPHPDVAHRFLCATGKQIMPPGTGVAIPLREFAAMTKHGRS